MRAARALLWNPLQLNVGVRWAHRFVVYDASSDSQRSDSWPALGSGLAARRSRRGCRLPLDRDSAPADRLGLFRHVHWTGVCERSDVRRAFEPSRARPNRRGRPARSARRLGSHRRREHPILFCLIVLAFLPGDVHLARSAYGLFTLLGLLGAATAELSIALAKRAAPIEIVAPPT